MSKNNKGFTLIEMMFVMVIITIMLLILVPRAYRATIDTKYALLRHSCAELASRGTLWAEMEIAGQDDSGCTAQLVDYYGYLCQTGAGPSTQVTVANATGAATVRSNWVASQISAPDANALGWVTPLGTNGVLNGRLVGTVASPPSGPAANFMPKSKIDRNPFNSQSHFDVANDPIITLMPIPGAIACSYIQDLSVTLATTSAYFGFVFQGVDSLGSTFVPATTFAQNMGVDNLNLLRNGVFWIRLSTHP